MTVRELIQKLQVVLAEHGDIRVTTDSDVGLQDADDPTVTEVDSFEAENGHLSGVVAGEKVVYI